MNHNELESTGIEKAYDVHLFPIVRVKISNVIATSQTEAIDKAYERVGALHTYFDRQYGKGETVDHIEYAEEERYYMVDEAGDSDYLKTRWYEPDGDEYKMMDKTDEPSFSYHNDGEHPEHTLEDWRQEVCECNTVLGYEEWVRHRIEWIKTDPNL